MKKSKKPKKFNRSEFEKAGWEFIEGDSRDYGNDMAKFKSPRMTKIRPLWLRLNDPNLTKDYLLDLEYRIFTEETLDLAMKELRVLVHENVKTNYKPLSV